MPGKLEFGHFICNLRSERNLPQRTVASALGIDISMLSKIENGERQLQAHMLPDLATVLQFDFKELQIHFLTSRIERDFGGQPYLRESLERILNQKETTQP